MAYDEVVANRIREVLSETPGFSERKMFGGLCFMVRGNMCGGIVGDELMLRVGADRQAEALGRPHCREMDFTGRSIKSMVYVAKEGFEADEALRDWLGLALEFMATLPSKS